MTQQTTSVRTDIPDHIAEIADSLAAEDRTPATQLSQFQVHILAAVNYFERAEDEPPIGLDVMQLLECFYGGPLHHGRFYPNVQELEDENLLKRERKDNRSKHVRLTDAGRQTLDAEAAFIRGR